MSEPNPRRNGPASGIPSKSSATKKAYGVTICRVSLRVKSAILWVLSVDSDSILLSD